jgi:hypothetical protein
MSQADANVLATSQIAGTDVRKAGGYLGGEVMNKVTAYSSQMAGVAGAPTSGAAQAALAQSNIPNTAAVQTAVTPTPAAGATTQQAEAARQTAAAADSRRTDRPQTAVAGARQETPESLLASLNTKMDQLIAINRSLKDTNERQLSVQKGIAQGGDLYAAA